MKNIIVVSATRYCCAASASTLITHEHSPNEQNQKGKPKREGHHSVCVVFTLNRYQVTQCPCVLILHPREIQILWSQTENREKSNKVIASKSRKVGKSNANVTDTIALVRRRFENRLHLISSSKMVSWFLQSFCSI